MLPISTSLKSAKDSDEGILSLFLGKSGTCSLFVNNSDPPPTATISGQGLEFGTVKGVPAHGRGETVWDLRSLPTP